ncbi:SpoIIE family protein phosphatase [Frankia sp. Cas4]|uniref:SpoIIE family protein phosphatase n=1 Tax=Frankia sp. Cas4 TaxID=3073927 RepID=UPI002AD49115|nr:SpoIIE family protein phosphatase [Frankia sp. Cas4]
MNSLELATRLADLAPAGLFIVDAQLRVLRTNQAMLTHNALSADDIGKQTVADLFPDVAPYLWDMIRKVLRTGEPILNVEITDSAPGSWPDRRVWRLSHHPIRNRDGVTVAVGVAVVDVTRRRRAEAERGAAEQRLRLLSRASALVGASLKLSDTLDALVELVVPEFADNCEVLLAPTPFDAASRPDPLIMQGFASPNRPSSAPLPTDAVESVGVLVELSRDNPAHQALATRRPVLFDVDDRVIQSVRVREPHRHSPQVHFERIQIDVAIVAPLLVGEQFFGVVYFGLFASRQRYGDYELQTAAELGSRLASSVANIRAYQRQRAAALTLQRGLLPHDTPAVEGLDIAWRYEPGTAGTEVGGDWFDIIALSAGRVALVIGDVMGRGLAAAAVMGQARTAVRAFAALDLPAADVLTHLNDLVQTIGTGPDATLISCVYAIFEPAGGTICVANAGHLDPVLTCPDGEVHHLGGHGDPILGLGLGEQTAYAETWHAFPAGSTLALFTDGLVESPAIDIGEGCRRLERTLGTIHGSAERTDAPDLEMTADRLLALLDRSEGYDDDVALLLVRATATATTATATIAPLPQAAKAAREAVLATLKRWGVDNDAFTVELLVSELVTNAIRYANTPGRLVLRRGRHALYVEVSDEDTRVPRLLHPTVDDEGGRGLQLVAELATRWGARPTRTGKTVWFQLDIPSS